jgi:hypothetical protein
MTVENKSFDGIKLDCYNVGMFWRPLWILTHVNPQKDSVFPYMTYMLICLQIENDTEFKWIPSELEAGNWESEGTWFSRLRHVTLESLLPVLNLRAVDSGHKSRTVLTDDYLERYLYSAFTGGKQSPEGQDSFPEQFPIVDTSLPVWRDMFLEDACLIGDELGLVSSDVTSDSGFRQKEPPVAPEDIREALDLSAKVRDEFINTIEENVHPVPSFLQCC